MVTTPDKRADVLFANDLRNTNNIDVFESKLFKI